MEKLFYVTKALKYCSKSGHDSPQSYVGASSKNARKKGQRGPAADFDAELLHAQAEIARDEKKKQSAKKGGGNTKKTQQHTAKNKKKKK